MDAFSRPRLSGEGVWWVYIRRWVCRPLRHSVRLHKSAEFLILPNNERKQIKNSPGKAHSCSTVTSSKFSFHHRLPPDIRASSDIFLIISRSDETTRRAEKKKQSETKQQWHKMLSFSMKLKSDNWDYWKKINGKRVRLSEPEDCKSRCIMSLRSESHGLLVIPFMIFVFQAARATQIPRKLNFLL